MCPGSQRGFGNSGHSGFMLLSAVFVLLICATLGVLIVNSVEQGSSNRAVNYWSTQAHLYAQSSLSFVAEDVDVCQNTMTRQALEMQLSRWFSAKNRVCTLSYDCETQEKRVVARVSCEINQELRVSRSAVKPLAVDALLTR